MNPFEQKPSRKAGAFQSWKSLYPKAYCKDETDAYTKVRIILMTGAEYEAVWFGHQFHRHCTDNDLRRELAVVRRQEQQQQHQLAYLKPADETSWRPPSPMSSWRWTLPPSWPSGSRTPMW